MFEQILECYLQQGLFNIQFNKSTNVFGGGGRGWVYMKGVELRPQGVEGSLNVLSSAP